jgi:hypothetical protein
MSNGIIFTVGVSRTPLKNMYPDERENTDIVCSLPMSLGLFTPFCRSLREIQYKGRMMKTIWSEE